MMTMSTVRDQKPPCLKDAFCQYVSTHITNSVKTVITRTIFSILLIIILGTAIYMGPIAILLATLIIQMKCFFELIDIAYKMGKMIEIPWFRSLSWYFLIAANYFFYGENVMQYFYVFIEDIPKLRFLILYHRFLSFMIYMVGVGLFIFSLKRKYGRRQFTLLAWTHVALLVVVYSSYTVVRNLFQGMIWVSMGVITMACNDIFAYVCGKLFGKTPLIKVSPKKTWEGFIGGAIFSITISFVIALVMCRYDYLVCPIEYRNVNGTIRMLTECERSPLFKLKNYNFTLKLLDVSLKVVLNTYPFVLHSFWFSLFGSLIAPFGGFFASGFKRAFNVKDFGSTIPGHGGVLDRFDCQIFMTNFLNVYISTFVKPMSVDVLFTRIMRMKPEDQVDFFYMFQDHLFKNVINAP